jgi:hypothetical protein
MKKTGCCPNCSSTEVYTTKGTPKRGDRSSIGVSSFTSVFIDLYICTNCGFIEEYAEEADLKNPKKMEKLKIIFKKVNP